MATTFEDRATGTLPPPIAPGAWLGMLGGGQLGRMFCFAAQSMGYRVIVLDPDATSPAGSVADRHLRAAYDDETALAELGRLAAAVTTEFENVPARSLDLLSKVTRVSPAGRCVAIAQDRLQEKRFIAGCGVPVAPHLAIETPLALATLDDAALAPMLPGILKTARLGYDGKGQVRVATPEALRQAYLELGNVPCVLEKRLSLAYEVSVVAARGESGQLAVYPLARNRHSHGILAETLAPAPDVEATMAEEARRAAAAIAEGLNYVGVLCVEFFIVREDRDGAAGVLSLVANEMAPRPHNSGHHTIDACVSSQFEQQVRAMTGMPLGEVRQHSSAVMLNLLGDVWFDRDDATQPPQLPRWEQVLAIPAAHLHLYGKQEARRGRKMGHLTFTAPTLDEARRAATEGARLLGIELDA
ncbi:MAG: 5-(carboxyamino)imidazole ribonucleotide synthase [Janthinobacterium lividum]